MSDNSCPIKRFTSSIDEPTSVFIDITFLGQELNHSRRFYKSLYNGKSPQFPRKQIPSQIDASLLLRALCSYGHARADKTHIFAFFTQRSNIIDCHGVGFITPIQCTGSAWTEMGNLLKTRPFPIRIILVADDSRYIPLVDTLEKQGIPIGLIKHKRTGFFDRHSQMPPHLPYQFAYYIAGASLGLSGGEL